MYRDKGILNKQKDNPAIIITTHLLLLCSIFCLLSCVSRESLGDKRHYVYLTDSSRFFLMPPQGIEEPIDMLQHISASYNNRDFFFNAWVKADTTGIEMILLNEMGASLGELSYREGELVFNSSIFPASLRPEYIVADFQLCFYNPALLERSLEESGLTMISSDNLQNHTRHIYEGNKLIIEIEKSSNFISLLNHLRGYTYTLEGVF